MSMITIRFPLLAMHKLVFWLLELETTVTRVGNINKQYSHNVAMIMKILVQKWAKKNDCAIILKVQKWTHIDYENWISILQPLDDYLLYIHL